MRVSDVMTAGPVTCSTEARLTTVALLMTECGCGEIPVIDPVENALIGVVTDRDIVCRAVASGKTPTLTRAREVMTTPAVTVKPDDDIDRAISIMVRHGVRRLPVVDSRGECVGMLSHTDIARSASVQTVGDLERAFAQPKLVTYDY